MTGTRRVKIGNRWIGGGEKVAVQSMCTFKTSETDKVIGQILGLEKAGCDIIRVSVLDDRDAVAIRAIKKAIHIPLVADIHFSARLATEAIEHGCDKVRINPGNIGSEEKVKLVADCVRAHGIPVRVGANSGSIQREYLERYGVSAEALVESALSEVRILEKYGVENIVIAVKSSSAPMTVKAYRLLSSRTDYPLHIGVTEAGTLETATVKSAAALGSLLMDGIGDTMRVSISADPIEEVRVAREILRACGLEKDFAEVICCPTCGRCRWNAMALAAKVQEKVKGVEKPLKIAVMGCIVNGPGEARECDLGIAGDRDYCVIFRKGAVVRRIEAWEAEREFFKELDEIINA
ncbi:MAG: flavodoxin-dependent (E)-4-hydroxy-3-methylbut-2-enyl-diphosphate synthase [Clostridia bacterium]|nr:flavodoxin-dependent (E)-4-hydroxy-3-methylbut-2-enyl-diphosphate synthase [Clostridia bacterium]